MTTTPSSIAQSPHRGERSSSSPMTSAQISLDSTVASHTGSSLSSLGTSSGQNSKRASPEPATPTASLPVDVSEAVEGGRKKRQKKDDNNVYCHQDHQHHAKDAPGLKLCASGIKRTKGLVCSLAFCGKCLLKYPLQPEANDKMDVDGEAWSCPVCRDICVCSSCRKKRGEPTATELRAIKKGATNALSEASDKGTRSSKIQLSNHGASTSKSHPSTSSRAPGSPSSSLSSLSDIDDAPNSTTTLSAPTKAGTTSKPPALKPPKAAPKRVAAPTGVTVIREPNWGLVALKEFSLRFCPDSPGWKANNDSAQKSVLIGLLDLFLDPKSLDQRPTGWTKSALSEIRNEVKNGAPDSKTWGAMRQLLLNSGWEEEMENWDEEEWMDEEDDAARGSRKTRGAKERVPEPQRVRICDFMIERVVETDTLRDLIAVGAEEERKAGVAAYHARIAIKAELTQLKNDLSTGVAEATDAAKKEKLQTSMATALKKKQREVDLAFRELNSDLHLSAMATRVRFGSLGSDAQHRSYYLCSPFPHSSYPYAKDRSSEVKPDEAHGYTLVVQGRPFPSSKEPIVDVNPESEEAIVCQQIHTAVEVEKMAAFVEFLEKHAKFAGKELPPATELVTGLRNFAAFLASGEDKVNGKGKARAV